MAQHDRLAIGQEGLSNNTCTGTRCKAKNGGQARVQVSCGGIHSGVFTFLLPLNRYRVVWTAKQKQASFFKFYDTRNYLIASNGGVQLTAYTTGRKAEGAEADWQGHAIWIHGQNCEHERGPPGVGVYLRRSRTARRGVWRRRTLVLAATGRDGRKFRHQSRCLWSKADVSEDNSNMSAK